MLMIPRFLLLLECSLLCPDNCFHVPSSFGVHLIIRVSARSQGNRLGSVIAFTKPDRHMQLLLVHFQLLSSVLLGSLLNPCMCRR